MSSRSLLAWTADEAGMKPEDGWIVVVGVCAKAVEVVVLVKVVLVTVDGMKVAAVPGKPTAILDYRIQCLTGGCIGRCREEGVCLLHQSGGGCICLGCADGHGIWWRRQGGNWGGC